MGYLRDMVRGAFGAAALVAVAWLLIRHCQNSDDHTTNATLPVATKRVHRSAANEPTDPPGTLLLEGQVIDEQQQPVVGADVMLSPGDRHATTDAGGSFVFDELIERSYRLDARKKSLYASVAKYRLSANSEPVMLHVRRGATLVIHVLDGGDPLAGATIVLDGGVTETTDAEGKAKIEGLGPHFHSFEVSAASRAPAYVHFMADDDPDATIERTVALTHGALVAGTALGPDGKHVAGAIISAEMSEWSGRVEADADGRWQFDALGAGTLRLHAASETLGPTSDLTLQLDGASPQRDVVVHLAEDAQLVGTVVDAEGKPVPNAVVTASTTRLSYHKRTGQDGRFEFLGIVAATYDVVAFTRRLGASAVRMTLVDGKRTEVKLVLEATSIAGVVLDSTGSPVADARVTAMREGNLVATTDIADAHGRFELGDIEPGDYRVSATWPNQLERRLGNGDIVKAGARNVRIVLEQSAVITGRAVLDGAPLAYYGVLLTEHPEFSFMGSPVSVRAADGRFTLRGVSPGRWGIVLLGPGTARKILSEVDVAQGKTFDLGDIAMARGQRIRGQVTDADGRPVSGATVSIGLHASTTVDREPLEELFGGNYTTLTDDAGAYAFAGVASVSLQASSIVASHIDRGTSTTTKLPEGDGVVDLKLLATGGIDGVVEGNLESAGMIHLGNRIARVERASGAFRFDGIPPGEYTLSMMPRRGSLAPPPVTVTVIAGQRATVRLALPASGITLVAKVHGGCTVVMMMTAGEDSEIRGTAGCSSGTAEFDNVAPGTYSVCASNCVPVTVLSIPQRQTVEF